MSTDLLTPLTLRCGLALSNRIAKSAMTEALGDRARLPSPPLLRLYGRWADCGAGLMITGNVGIDRAHPVRARDVILEADSDLGPFREWARVAKGGGARVVMQLNHGGRQTPRFVNPRPIGPSTGAAVKIMRAFGAPRAATEAELADIIARFATAAARAEEAGFDGVQIHAAHGYLLNQFLAPDVNRRSDGWGGDVAGRARLLVEIVRAVRATTGPRFAVMVKLNAADFLRGGFDEDDSLAVVRMLHEERLDLLEVSGGRYESGASFGHATTTPSPQGYFARFAARARQVTDTPVMLTGGLRTRRAMDEALGDGVLDVVGIARPMALVPEYARALLDDAEVPTIAPRRIGVAALEGASELAWYSWQLGRVARGLEPDLRASPWRALFAYLFDDFWEGLRQRAQLRAQRREPARLPEAT